MSLGGKEVIGAFTAGLLLTPDLLAAGARGQGEKGCLAGAHRASFDGIPLSKPLLDVHFEFLLDPILF